MRNAFTHTRLPMFFIGHGSPLTAFEDNKFTQEWTRLGSEIPTPRAVLCVSAHWYTRGTGITAQAQPRTIHDFSGFPEALYQFHYPAPGDPELAQHVGELLAPASVTQDQQWGFDHGCWTVLKHLYPRADIPVVQLSIDATRDNDWHYAIGKQLASLRDEGVLIVASGNVVHNLQRIHFSESAAAYPWAQKFDQYVRAALETRNHQALINYEGAGDEAIMAVPTPEHYLPLLYVLGASDVSEPLNVTLDEIVLGSISMLSVKIGA